MVPRFSIRETKGGHDCEIVKAIKYASYVSLIAGLTTTILQTGKTVTHVCLQTLFNNTLLRSNHCAIWKPKSELHAGLRDIFRAHLLLALCVIILKQSLYHFKGRTSIIFRSFSSETVGRGRRHQSRCNSAPATLCFAVVAILRRIRLSIWCFSQNSSRTDDWGSKSTPLFVF